MARREVELLIRARDQASQIAKQITDSFDKLAQSQNQLADEGADTTGVLARLRSELAQLQTAATGLGQFQRVATSVDRASASIAKLETNLARSQVAFDQAAQKAGLAATSYSDFQNRARQAGEALDQQRARLAAAEAEQLRLNQAVALAGASYRKLRSDVISAAQPSDALKNSVRDQRDALVALVEQQTRQNAAVQQQRAAVQAAQQAFTALNREVAGASTTLARANNALKSTEAAATAEAAALNEARNNFNELQQAAQQSSAALGGVEANQKSIAEASQRTAQAIQSVSAALAQQRAALAQAGSANLGGPAAQATAAFRQQIQAVTQTRQAWQQAQAEAKRLGDAMRATTNPSAALRAEFTLARLEAGRLKDAYEQQQAALDRTRAGIQFVRTAFEPFTVSAQRAAQAQVQASQGATTLTGRLSQLVRQLLGVKTQADQTTQSVAKLAATSERTALARAFGVENNRVASRLQNLSFQINDIVSGLASGQRPAQIFAQQIGQIGQLFPAFNNLLLAAIRFLPVLATMAVLLSPIISAFIRLGEQAATLRQFNSVLAGTGEATRATAQELTNVAQRLDRYGLSLKDAIAAEREFLTQGIAIENFELLGQAAQNLAKVMGVDTPQAAERLARAVSGGARQALDLDRSLRFLTASERERLLAIEADVDATRRLTNEQEAANITLQALQRKNDEVAESARGPWSRAFREVGRAFNDMVTAFQNTGFAQAIGNAFDRLAQKTESAAQGFRRLGAFLTNGFDAGRAVAQVAATDRAAQAGRNALSPEEITRREQERTARQNAFNAQLQREEASRRRIAEATRQGAEAAAAQRAEEELINRARSEGVVLSREQIDNARQAAVEQERARQSASAARREGAGLVARQREYNAAIERTISEREEEIDRLGKTRREQAIMLAVSQAEIRATQQRVELTDELRKRVSDSAAALFDAQQAEQLRLNVLQQQIELRQLLNQTVSVEQQLQEEAILANIDLTSQYGQEWANARRQVIETTNAIREANRLREESTALAAQLRQSEREIRQAQSEGESRDQIQARIDEAAALRDRLVEVRDAAIAAFLALGDEETAARLQAINTTLDTTRAQVLTIADANRDLSEGLTNGIIAATEQIALAIDKTQSWGDALSNIGDIFRQFAADFLRRIAQMIIQALILRAIQNSGWGGLISGAVNAASAHGGRVIGSRGRARQVDPRVFAGAMRFHTGGIPGLSRSEVPAILQRGEEVLSRRDPRNVLNGGAQGASGSGLQVRNVNVFDSADVLAQALSRVGGERVIMNYVRENANAINDALGTVR